MPRPFEYEIVTRATDPATGKLARDKRGKLEEPYTLRVPTRLGAPRLTRKGKGAAMLPSAPGFNPFALRSAERYAKWLVREAKGRLRADVHRYPARYEEVVAQRAREKVRVYRRHRPYFTIAGNGVPRRTTSATRVLQVVYDRRTGRAVVEER